MLNLWLRLDLLLEIIMQLLLLEQLTRDLILAVYLVELHLQQLLVLQVRLFLLVISPATM